MDLDDLLSRLDTRVRTELKCKPEVIEKEDFTESELPIIARRWIKVGDVVAVFADLKNSTHLEVGKHASSTASIYEAGTGGVVEIFDDFDPNFISIQGDGVFALFWGSLRFEKALCAGITIKTFSKNQFAPKLEAKWPTAPPTGFKVGVASSPLLVKRVGIPRKPYQEPVWPGRAVNYAAKCAQQADRHELIVTGTVWEKIKKNDYLAISCGCPNGPSAEIWVDCEIEKVPENRPDRHGRKLCSVWCERHGASFCKEILDERTKRSDTIDLRVKLDKAESDKFQSTLLRMASTRAAHRHGFS